MTPQAGTYGVTTYRLLIERYSRNDAYDICRLYGGNIIRPDHFEKLVRLSHLNNREWAWQLRHEYWIDLILDPVNATLIWTSNCEALDPSNDWNCIPSNFDMSSSDLCITSKHGGDWNNKECDSDALVLCETFQAGTTCTYGSAMKFPILSIYGDTEAVCQTNCAAEPSCWSYTYSPTSPTRGTCVLGFDSSKQEDPAFVMSTTATKHCYVGELVTQIDPTWSFGQNNNNNNNNDQKPVYNCTAVSATDSQKKQQNITNQNLFNITNQNDPCSTMTLIEYQTLTVLDTTTKDVMVLITVNPTTVVMTTEIQTTLIMTTTEVPSPVVTTIVSTELATTTLEIPTTITTTTVVPASNVTITITPSVVPMTTVVSHDVITATAEVPTTVVVTETPSVIVSTLAVTVAATSTVVIPTTVVSSETHATTVVVTTTVVATTWSSVSSLAPAALAEKLDNMVRNLTVPKKNTKAYQRTLGCAEDDRQSAKTVGYIGILLLIFPLGLMICLDIPSAIIRIRNFRKVSES
ncbi:mucin-2-like [Mizuhopecten yessoensis]|uniref:C-type lectin domain-containing protein n=1 Tax=Mizuhopecten yessoensis TaxID=6573 RepID=A0A210QLC6_MIZYE|nr:mucin-2-like [Mizuhopecten yessoensis]OWF49540.1 hypothetical protein KP79_PYT17476 [Mizuhopecten yessoensis]